MDAIQVLQNILDENKEKIGDGMYLELSNAIMKVHKMKTEIPNAVSEELRYLRRHYQISMNLLRKLQDDITLLEHDLLCSKEFHNMQKTRELERTVKTLQEKLYDMTTHRDRLLTKVETMRQECDALQNENENLKRKLGCLSFVKLDKEKCECGAMISPLHMERHLSGKKHLDAMKELQKVK